MRCEEGALTIKAPLVLQVQVGGPRTLGKEGAGDPMDQSWTSSIFKEPVEGPVRLSRAGLAGDAVTDKGDHGGAEMAVLGYSAEHYSIWRQELEQPFLKYGAFGENLTISRVDEDSVCVGDIYSVGEARIQVSKPRLPCWKLSRRLRVKDMAERVDSRSWGGWYCRVLTEGHIERSNFFVLEERSYPQWTVARVYQVYRRRHQDRRSAADLAACELLSPDWRSSLATP